MPITLKNIPAVNVPTPATDKITLFTDTNDLLYSKNDNGTVSLIGGGSGPSAPFYEEFVATASQTVFNTSINTTPKTSNTAYLTIFVNGIFQQEGIGKSYTVTGPNQITFNTGLTLNSDVVMYSYL